MGEFSGEKFLKEMKRWGISLNYSYGRIILSNGNVNALEHYKKFISLYPECEVEIIFELSKINRDVMDIIEERAAIREADGLAGDLESAIRCNIF